MQECSLDSEEIYAKCIEFLSLDIKRILEIENLIKCIKTNASCGNNSIDPEISNMCDRLVCKAVQVVYDTHDANAKAEIDQLIKLISSATMKIQCYINSNQLKTAFVESAALNLVDYIKDIMKLAESTRQDNVKKLCERKLMSICCDSESMNSESISNLFNT